MIIKDGLLICRSCGTRYIVGGIENHQKAANHRKIAKRAYEEKDYKTAKKYYDLILSDDPDDWEAYCYSRLSEVLFSGSNVTFEDLVSFNRSIKTIVSLIFGTSDNGKELRDIIERVNKDMRSASQYLFNKAYEQSYEYEYDFDEAEEERWDKNESRIEDILYQACVVLSEWNNQIRNFCEESDIEVGLEKEFFIEDYKQLSEQLYYIKDYNKANIRKAIKDIVAYIRTEEPEWQIPGPVLEKF